MLFLTVWVFRQETAQRVLQTLLVDARKVLDGLAADASQRAHDLAVSDVSEANGRVEDMQAYMRRLGLASIPELLPAWPHIISIHTHIYIYMSMKNKGCICAETKVPTRVHAHSACMHPPYVATVTCLRVRSLLVFQLPVSRCGYVSIMSIVVVPGLPCLPCIRRGPWQVLLGANTFVMHAFLVAMAAVNCMSLRVIQLLVSRCECVSCMSCRTYSRRARPARFKPRGLGQVLRAWTLRAPSGEAGAPGRSPGYACVDTHDHDCHVPLAHLWWPACGTGARTPVQAPSTCMRHGARGRGHLYGTPKPPCLPAARVSVYR